jgi:hypothetical protein
MAVKGKKNRERERKRKRGASRDEKQNEAGKEKKEYEVKNTFKDRTKKEVAAWVAQGGKEREVQKEGAPLGYKGGIESSPGKGKDKELVMSK